MISNENMTKTKVDDTGTSVDPCTVSMPAPQQSQAILCRSVHHIRALGRAQPFQTISRTPDLPWRSSTVDMESPLFPRKLYAGAPF